MNKYILSPMMNLPLSYNDMKNQEGLALYLPFSVICIGGLLYRSRIQPRMFRKPFGTINSHGDAAYNNKPFKFNIFIHCKW